MRAASSPAIRSACAGVPATGRQPTRCQVATCRSALLQKPWKTASASPRRRRRRTGSPHQHQHQRPLRPQCRSSEKVSYSADAFFDFDKAVLKPEGKASAGRPGLASCKASTWKSSSPSATPTRSVPMRTTRSCRSAALKLSRLTCCRKGVEANRVYTEGKGEKQPVADNKTDRRPRQEPSR